jgi:hypothetical protein
MQRIKLREKDGKEKKVTVTKEINKVKRESNKGRGHR